MKSKDKIVAAYGSLASSKFAKPAIWESAVGEGVMIEPAR